MSEMALRWATLRRVNLRRAALRWVTLRRVVGWEPSGQLELPTRVETDHSRSSAGMRRLSGASRLQRRLVSEHRSERARRVSIERGTREARSELATGAERTPDERLREEAMA